jgi:ABC-type bacteriocin/lantibiotic exporter with double-glycine peptidase domain
MISRTNAVYLILILSILALFVSNQVQTVYGDVIPKSHFDILTAIAFFILIITILPLTRTYILRA